MQLKIKELKGNEFSIKIELNETVASLKNLISVQTGIPVIEQKLLLGGKILIDDKSLEFYNVSESSKIMLTRAKVDLKSLIQKALGKFYDSEKCE